MYKDVVSLSLSLSRYISIYIYIYYIITIVVCLILAILSCKSMLTQIKVDVANRSHVHSNNTEVCDVDQNIEPRAPR